MRVTYGDIYDSTSVPSGFHADDWAIPGGAEHYFHVYQKVYRRQK
jgi:hypothetical protein